ncbi:MAG: hypothetical protein RIB53_13395 [Roseitalea porphyridii]|uniref:hypothetical protein n=2 Tax=Roseitalea porphyridii TaxID=1852022 RepID=UPI0032EC66A0
MTALALPAPAPARAGPLALWNRMRNDEPLFAATALFLALAIIPLAAAGMIDPRLHLGENIWVKPIKFAVALSVYTATLALFARYLPAGMTRRTAYRLFAGAVVFAIAAEMAWIGGAAAMGTASHFNTGEPVWAALYPVMGAMAALLTSASAVYAVAIARNRDLTIAPALKAGLVWGLGLTLPLTLVTAGTMSSLNGHNVGGSGMATEGLWLIGWLRDGGDLRVAHFFATHAMHFVPAFALALVWLGRPRESRAVHGFALAFALFVLATFAQALMGRPFLAMIG